MMTRVKVHQPLYKKITNRISTALLFLLHASVSRTPTPAVTTPLTAAKSLEQDQDVQYNNYIYCSGELTWSEMNYQRTKGVKDSFQKSRRCFGTPRRSMRGREWSAVIAVDVILGRSGMSGRATPKVALSKYRFPIESFQGLNWHPTIRSRPKGTRSPLTSGKRLSSVPSRRFLATGAKQRMSYLRTTTLPITWQTKSSIDSLVEQMRRLSSCRALSWACGLFATR